MAAKRAALGMRVIALIVALWSCAGAAFAQTLAERFAAPPDEARPMVRWWWFGPATENAELAREIGAMRAQGFGGFEIQPVYPLALDDPASGFSNQRFLSPEFLDAVRFAAETGRAQGMRVDVTLGSGWPFGGPHIPAAQAASSLRLVSVALAPGARDAPLPTLGAGEALLAVFLADGAPEAPDAARAVRLRVVEGATRVAVTPVNQARVVLAFVQSRTGQQVKRAALGSEGFVLDHMSAAAIRNHIESVGAPLLGALENSLPYAVFSDSLEAYGSDWTDDLPAEFRRRRGYDLIERLPALFFDAGPDTGAIRHDWALTLSELTDERYLIPLNAWARERGTRFRSQTYGIPPVTLSSSRLVDLAEGEGVHWRRATSMRWTSSANHLYGRAVTSAEAWTWLHSPSFRATPLDVKAEADMLLLSGANLFIAHGWPYTPPQVAEPGWAFYAAAVFNDRTPWRGVMADVNAYVQRLSFLLSQGESVADIAILVPTEDAFASIKAGNPSRASVNERVREFASDALIAQILDAGYSFDLIDGPALDAPGFKHKVLILPRLTRIAPDVYRKIAAFVERGGAVLAVERLPERGGGLRNAEAEAREVRAINAALFAPGATKARIVEEVGVSAALHALVPPDLVGAPEGLGFVHRTMADGDVYFVANTTNQPMWARLRFRAEGAPAQWWEPRTGAAFGWAQDEEVALAPYESRVFVFGAVANATVTTSSERSARPSIDLNAGWRVRFGGAGESRAVTLPHMWTEAEATRFFSGEAVYTRTLNLTRAHVAAGITVLRFGDGAPIALPAGQRGSMALLDAPVREAAEVFVNGRRVGAVWSAPYAIDLAGFLQPGANRLEVRVSNTSINALAGRGATDYRLLNLRYGERFQMQDMENLAPIPSGLMGPITLETAP